MTETLWGWHTLRLENQEYVAEPMLFYPNSDPNYPK